MPGQLPDSVCPCCRQPAWLKQDHAAPAPVFLCTPCLQVINILVKASPETRENIETYLSWRKEKPAGVVAPAGSEEVEVGVPEGNLKQDLS